ncbi:MAG: Ig-like domain-containing protein [Anaerolineae bacterium]
MSVFRTIVIILLAALVLAGGVASGVLAQNEGDTIDVTGRVTYVDNEGLIQPAAGVRVAIRDWDYLPTEGPSETLAEVITDEDGYFSATDIDNQDIDGSPRRPDRTGQDVLIEVRTMSPPIKLLNTSTLQPFVWSSFGQVGGFFRNVEAGSIVPVNLRVQASDRQVQGMAVYQTMRAGWDYLPQKPALDEPILAQWGANSLDGPYYVPGDRIYYDASAAIFPHVILHQFAHALAWAIQGEAGYPTSCFPAPDDHTFDMKSLSTAECAWTEGWAAGFAMIVLDDPRYRTAEGVTDMEIPDIDTPGWDEGDRVAGRVAGALWDLYDDVDDGFDMYTPDGSTPQARFAPAWEAYMAGTPTTTAEFWSAFLAGGHDACSAVSAFFQNTIDYNEAPQVQALPDVTLDEDTSADNVIDLWQYSSDVECPDDRLTYTLVEGIPPEFGVSIDSNRYIDVNPDPNWFGTIEVGIQVSDGLESARRFFTLTVGSVNDNPTLGEIPRFEALINTPIVVDLEPYVDDVDNLKSDLTPSVQFLDHAGVAVNGLVLTFTPDQNFEGTVTPRVHVDDGAGGFAETDLVLIWSRSPNHSPQIVGLPPIFHQDAGQSILINFKDYGQDLEDPPATLVWTVEEIGEHASVLRQDNTTLVFSPQPADYKGSETAMVVVTDKDGGRSQPAEVRLLWTEPRNQPPIIVRVIRDRKAFIGRPLTLNLEGYATDPDGNDAALIWFANMATVDCCQVSLVEKQKIVFFPLQGWGAQSDEVELVVRDPQGAEARANILLTWDLARVFLPFVGRGVSGP